MKRVLVAGTAVALVDGSLLGIAMALGWTAVVVVAGLAGVAGAVLVALATPPARTTAAPTVTLSLPVREATADSPDVAEPAAGPALAPAATIGDKAIGDTALGDTPAPVAA